MQSRGLERFAPLTGVVFVVLVVVAFILSSDPPSADDGTQKILSYWSDNDSKEIASAILGTFAAIFLVWFAGSLRSAIIGAEAGAGRLASLAFAGAVIAAIGVLIACSIEFTTAESAGDVPPSATLALSALNSDFFFPLVAGVAILLFATGLAAVRLLVLPRWLGWVSIALAVLCVTPIGFIALLVSVLWVGLVGVLLFLRQAAPTATTAPTT